MPRTPTLTIFMTMQTNSVKNISGKKHDCPEPGGESNAPRRSLRPGYERSQLQDRFPNARFKTEEASSKKGIVACAVLEM